MSNDERYIVTDSMPVPLAETSDMIEMHRVFRTCFGESSVLVRSVAPGDSEQAGVVASYFANVLRLLRVHHEGEDVLVTPKLLERDPDQTKTIERIAAQHADVVVLMDDAEARLARWRQSLDGSDRADLIQALTRLDGELTVHLDAEEAELLPIVARCMDAAEWGELPSHGMQHFDGDKLWLVMGLIREQMSPEHRADMDAHMPPPVAAMWTGSGNAMFSEFMERLSARTWQSAAAGH